MSVRARRSRPATGRPVRRARARDRALTTCLVVALGFLRGAAATALDNGNYDLTAIANAAALVVIGTVQAVGATDPAVPEAEDEGSNLRRMATIAVERTLVGRAPAPLRVLVSRDDEDDFPLGERVALFLTPYVDAQLPFGRPELDGRGNLITIGPWRRRHTVLHCDRGVVTVPGEVVDPLYAELLKPPVSVQRLVDVLALMRGPRLSCTVLDAAPRCDQPLHLDLAFANLSGLAMPIQWGPRADSGDEVFVSLAAGDFLVSNGRVSAAATQRLSLYVPGIQRVEIAPGATLHRRIAVAFDAGDFRVDPAATRTLHVRYLPQGPATTLADGWLGVADAEVPLALACPFPDWSASLAAPSASLLPFLAPRQSSGPTWRLPLRLQVELMQAGAENGEGLSYDAQPWSAEEGNALADACEVARDGAIVHRPVYGPVIDRITADYAEGKRTTRMAPLELGEHVGVTGPGSYRIRLVLDRGTPRCRSNQLEITVLAEAGAADGEAGH